MTRPTWEQATFLDDEAARKREAKSLEKMHLTHGKSEGNLCGDCQFFVRLIADMQMRPFKCQKYRVSHSASSDWRKKWTACGLFQTRKVEA